MKKSNLKSIIILSVLIALSCILSYFDSYICSLFTGGLIPYKLGLANVVIMVIVYQYNLKSSFLAVILKSLIVGLFLGNGYVTFLLSLLGSLLSLIGMLVFKKMLVKPQYTPFIGLIGGFLHPIGQIIGASIIYGFNEFFTASLMTLPILLISGIITGFLVGLTTQQVNRIF